MIASRVAATPPLTESPARDFFADKLRYETDPADVYADMQDGLRSFVLLDARSAADYAGKHAQGAESFAFIHLVFRGLSFANLCSLPYPFYP